MSKIISTKDLYEKACHYGQKTSNWNPKMKPFLFGKKNGVHIFNLDITGNKIADLLNRIAEIISSGKSILFVSTKPHTEEILTKINTQTGMPIVSYKWFGGLLTNFSTMKGRILHMKRLKSEFENNEITRYTKKEQIKFAKKLSKLVRALGGVSEMSKVPSAIFVVDGFRDKIAIAEAKKLNIEVLGIADSNVDPSDYDHFAPMNDDTVQSTDYLLEQVLEVILENQKKSPTN